MRNCRTTIEMINEVIAKTPINRTFKVPSKKSNPVRVKVDSSVINKAEIIAKRYDFFTRIAIIAQTCNQLP